jgi:hypothetical protein
MQEDRKAGEKKGGDDLEGSNALLALEAFAAFQ